MGKSKRKRANQPENLYERNGVWYARIQAGGVTRRESLKTRDREEAERRLEPWLKSLSLYHGTVRHTFDEAAARWLETGDWKAGTTKRYIQSLTVLTKHFGHLFWDQVDKGALMTFIEARRREGRTVATINRDLTVISGIAKHVSHLPGWPDFNPVEKLPAKPRKAKKWTYVRPPNEDIEAYFKRMQGTFGSLCFVALRTGARLTELTRLRISDARDGKLQLWETKSRFRVITCPPDAQEVIAKEAGKRDPSEPVFITRNGGPYKRVTEMWREVVLRAQKMAQRDGRSLRRMRFHDLRHEFAIRALESGRSLYTLRDHLGHSTIKQTEEYLRFLTPEQAEIVRSRSSQM